MVTKADFWQIMNSYGEAIWPMQIVFYLGALLLMAWLLVKPGRMKSLAAKIYFSLLFTFNGILYYLVLAKDMAGESRANTVFGAIFLLAAGLFLLDAFKQRMQFALPQTGLARYLTPGLMLLVFGYPLFGWLSSHGLTGLIFPGTHPCPTTALGLLLLTLALPKVNKLLLVILLVLAIPFTPFFQIARYGVWEDVILVVAGLYGLVLWVWNWRKPAA